MAAKLSGSGRQFTIEPNRRYLSVRLVHLKAFVDYVNPKEDEFIYATVSFLRQRFQTQAVPASTEVLFPEEDASMLFEF